MKESIFTLAIALAGALLSGFGAARAQTLPPCGQRPTVLLLPWTDTTRWCLEQVINNKSGGELSFTALAAAPDGVLYAARPLAGQVFALTDSDGDGLPESARVAAENLTLPNALAYHDGALYIAGGAYIYRLADGELETLVDDLPSGGGFWTGGLAIGAEGRIYVGTGAPCDFCEPGDETRGAILSYALDGSGRQIVAQGLRQPAALVYHAGALWTVDSARDGLADSASLDELNRVTPGAHFGWPYCVGRDNHPDLIPAAFDCATAAPPALTFPTHSIPLALASYTSDTFPSLAGTLLVVLAGKYDAVELPGYSVVAVTFDAGGNPLDSTSIIPAAQSGSRYAEIGAQNLSYEGRGFWPNHPLGVAVNAEGWVYISVTGGQILALRPL